MKKPLPKNRFKYSETNWQVSPSPLLADYMKKNNLTEVIPVDDAQEWFYSLRDSLKKKERKNA